MSKRIDDREYSHATSHTDPNAGLPKFSDLRGAFKVGMICRACMRLEVDCDCPGEVEQAVIDRIHQRREVGLKKYGVSVADNPLTREQWLRHLQEELLDGAIYAEKLLRDEQPPARQWDEGQVADLMAENARLREDAARLDWVLGHCEVEYSRDAMSLRNLDSREDIDEERKGSDER